MLPAAPQPDQEPRRWDDHVFVYEEVFEPFTLQFAQPAIAGLGLSAGQSVLDVGAGCGGAALAMAERGLRVTAVDASVRMVERMKARAAERGLSIDARVMDDQTLELPDASFDAALFGARHHLVSLPRARPGRAIIERFVANLEARHGQGPVNLCGVAFVGTAQVT
jgi:SAM-dependent methyltransferase